MLVLGNEILNLALTATNRLQRKLLIPFVGIRFVLVNVFANSVSLTFEFHFVISHLYFLPLRKVGT